MAKKNKNNEYNEEFENLDYDNFLEENDDLFFEKDLEHIVKDVLKNNLGSSNPY